MNEQNPPEGIHGVSRLGDFSAYFIVNKLLPGSVSLACW